MTPLDCDKPPAIVAKAHAPSQAAGAAHRYLHPGPLVETNCVRFEGAGEPLQPLAGMSFEQIERAEYEPMQPIEARAVESLPTERPEGDVGTEVGALPVPAVYGAPSPVLVSPVIPAVPELPVWALLLAPLAWVMRRRCASTAPGLQSNGTAG